MTTHFRTNVAAVYEANGVKVLGAAARAWCSLLGGMRYVLKSAVVMTILSEQPAHTQELPPGGHGAASTLVA